MNDDELRALLTLHALPGMPAERMTALLRHCGSARAALAGGTATLGSRAAGAARSVLVEERATRALRAVREFGLHVLVVGAAEYPQLPPGSEPPVIFARGRLELLQRTCVAVVGTRTCTEYGADIARDIGTALAHAGVVVVSGLARGIDGIAHDAALGADGETIAVLGCGVDVVYPPEHAQLQERIATAGLIISQFLPGTPPLRHHFPERNAVIAGLSRAVVVVEGSRRSGALSTASRALNFGIDVFAVPGPLGRRTSEGPIALLRDGAHVYTEPLDVLLAVGAVPGRSTATATPRGTPVNDAIPAPHASLWAALAREARHVDAIVAATGEPPTRVLVALLELEMEGWVQQLPGMRFRRRA